MKNFITLLMTVIFSLSLNAQDKGYVHTSTEENTVGDFNHRTLLDHPDLNGNPDAKVLFSQRYLTVTGVDNPHPTGLYYSAASSRWGIFNEDQIEMPVGTQFNVYIADDSDVITHVADASNSGANWTTLGAFAPSDYLFQNTYFNPNSVYNSHVYGNYYNSSQRLLYAEDLNAIPIGAGFRVMKGSNESATRVGILSSAANISGYGLELDIPQLNDNPDAVFLYSHYWGHPDGDNQVYLPSVTDAMYRYSTGKWYIFPYTISFPESVWIDIIIPDVVLGTDEVQQEFSKISLYPNPVVDMVNIASSKENIQAVEIYDVSGKMVQSFKDAGKSVSINVSALPSGMYIAKVLTDEGWFSKKLIKK